VEIVAEGLAITIPILGAYWGQCLVWLPYFDVCLCVVRRGLRTPRPTLNLGNYTLIWGKQEGSMKAILIEEFGGPEKMKVADIPAPKAGKGEVLIEVGYASVNPVDWKVREGYVKDLLPHRFPLILGWDAAGTVKALGEGVAGFEVGDAVYAYCRKAEIQWGTYAEYVAMDSSAVAPLPTGVSVREGAGIPLVALTAWQALTEFGAFKKDQTILVHGGAGGVGGYAIQFAKALGAKKIYTTASGGNASYVRELGADEAIDYQTKDFAAVINELEPGGLDMVLDCVGGESLEKSYDLVKKGGALASIVNAPSEARATAKGLRSAWVFVAPNGAQLRKIASLIEEQKVVPLPVEEMPLEKAFEALNKSQKGHVRGKLVLKVRG
jgi:NADPH:quinone reductase-like Zn-dependent oxidoreductase